MNNEIHPNNIIVKNNTNNIVQSTIPNNTLTVEKIDDSDAVFDKTTLSGITKDTPITTSKDTGVNTSHKYLTNIKLPQQRNRKKWNDTSLFYNFCMIINHIIISTTLLFVTYFLYKLTNEIRGIDFEKITDGLESVDENLNSVSQIGNQITTLMTNFQYSELANLDFNRINLVAQQFYDVGLQNIDIDNINILVETLNILTQQLYNAELQNINTDDINLLVSSLNQTLVNFNNAINNFRIPMFTPTITPQFDPTFNAEFSSQFDGTDNIDNGASESTSPIDPPTSPANPSTSTPNPPSPPSSTTPPNNPF